MRLKRVRLWLGRHIGGIVTGWILVFLTAGVALSLISVYQGRKDRRELCAFVDADHNRERARIVKGERDFLGPYRNAFPTISAKTVHRESKRAYEAVRSSRPNYCDGVRRNPIAPYPPLRTLEHQAKQQVQKQAKGKPAGLTPPSGTTGPNGQRQGSKGLNGVVTGPNGVQSRYIPKATHLPPGAAPLQPDQSVAPPQTVDGTPVTQPPIPPCIAVPLDGGICPAVPPVPKLP